MIFRIALLVLSAAAFVAELSASETAGKGTSSPVTNPWDANVWEPGSECIFWRAGVEKPKASARGKTTSSSATTPPSAAASAQRPPAKSDFSRRQSEK